MLYFFLQLHKILLCLNSLWCCVNLTNFLVFLYNGQYLHVYERLCGMRTVHVKGRALREVSDKKCFLSDVIGTQKFSPRQPDYCHSAVATFFSRILLP